MAPHIEKTREERARERGESGGRCLLSDALQERRAQGGMEDKRC